MLFIAVARTNNGLVVLGRIDRVSTSIVAESIPWVVLGNRLFFLVWHHLNRCFSLGPIARSDSELRVAVFFRLGLHNVGFITLALRKLSAVPPPDDTM